MKESILRAAAIAALALALIMSVTTWIGVSTSSQRGSVLIGFFEFALILFLGAVAWALFNAFADIVSSRNTLEMLTVRLVKLEEAVAGLAPAAAPDPAAPDPARAGRRDAGRSRPQPGRRGARPGNGGGLLIHHTIQGTAVPALGFGTFRLPGDDCREGVEHALGIGYRHIDTAQGYHNEEFVGEGLRRAGVPREDIFLVSKVSPDNFAGDGAATSTLESLRKLGTDYVDLMLLHWPNPEVPLEEPLTALARLQREGAVRHIGVSNFPPSLVEQAGAVTELFCNQVEYHPYLSQTRLLEQAQRHDLLLTAYCPIARGKVLDDPVLRDIGARHGKTPAQVTLRWLAQQERVAAIPKSAHAQRRMDNFDIFDFELSDDEMKAVFALDREQRLVDPAGGPDWER